LDDQHAAERTKVPNRIDTTVSNTDKAGGWSQRELLEFARLAPKSKEAGQPHDVDKLNKRDAERVAKKVIDHCEKEGAKLTSTVVRKFVDEELGVDRAAKAKQTRESAGIDLADYARRTLGTIEGIFEVLDKVTKDGWKLRLLWCAAAPWAGRCLSALLGPCGLLGASNRAGVLGRPARGRAGRGTAAWYRRLSFERFGEQRDETVASGAAGRTAEVDRRSPRVAQAGDCRGPAGVGPGRATWRSNRRDLSRARLR
jgi:hypothetical protein